ncbi:MAG: DEAD/DEAH box helicase [Myxococcota bacterium]|nr:DEAD/DEAH box helicase [Myxococcota bacterium]
MQALFDAIRDECPRAAWSRGVELARADAVSAERAGADEVVARVATPDGRLAPSVTLSIADACWDSDCDCPDDPCEHVAAAAIALRRARQEGRALPSPSERGAGHVRYQLRRERGGLVLERWIATGDEAVRLETSLEAVARGRVAGPAVLPERCDWDVEAALDEPAEPRPRLSRGALARLLPALAGCADVRLDDEPVETSAEPVVPVARLEDAPDGFRLVVDLAPGVSERLGDGVARCGRVLRPVRESRLTGRELAELPRGRVYPPDRAAELVNEVLPDLRKRVPVDVRTRRLPRTTRSEPPRIRVATRREGDALVAQADLVYGDPPCARVEDGRLVHLRGAVPLRDEVGERALARRIQHELGLAPGREVTLRETDAIALSGRLADFGGDVSGDAHESFFLAPALDVHVDLDPAHFDASFVSQAEGGERRAASTDVLRAWQAGRSLVPLAGGGFAPLPADWLAQFGRPLRALLEARGADGALPRAALPDLAALCEAQGAPAPPGFEALRALVGDFDGLPAAALPNDLRAELRPYQREGVDWLAFLRDADLGALLADDMGLGKTLQLLCALGGRTLVVAPTSVLYGWAQEIARFRPGLRVCAYHGPGRRLDPDAQVTLTSYAILRLDVEPLAAVDWDTAVLDEAQAIKNPASQVARAAHRLRARWRVALTGTPVENRLEELWSLLHFANPGLLGARAGFEADYARPIAAGDDAAGDELRRRIRPFVLRRHKSEVAPELPPRTERVLRCELDAEERRTYEAVRAATRREVVERLDGGASALAALEALLRLRQAACHRGLVPGQQADGSSKVALLLEELDTAVAEGHKALVFSQWTGLLDRVEPHLAAAGIAFTRLDGSTRDRGAVVERFQAADGPPVLLISLRAGGTGLNLTAADHVFLLDPWWNPAVEDQAADRAHRIGQTRPVVVHRLVAADTVEEGVLRLQQSKRSLADTALGTPAAPITREDLLGLLA